jgi:hypothetical protein
MNENNADRYRGVLCRCCNQPIALPAIISKLEHENTIENRDREEHAGARVFTVRCGLCEKEYPYPVNAIIEIEGSPRARLTRANGARALGRRLSGEMARAAHAS